MQLLGSSWALACGPLPRAQSSPAGASASAGGRVRAVAFDLFTLFDPRGVEQRVDSLLGPGTPLAATWKTKLFEYSWIRASAGQYVDFRQLVHDSLACAAEVHRLRIDAATGERLEAAFVELDPWPDALEALRLLRARGLRLAPLANFAPAMIDALLDRANMRGAFDSIISTDLARTYKPDPRAYALGPKVFGLPSQQIAFVAFGSWDAAGAHWYGFPTFWVNRLGAGPERLIDVDATGPGLQELIRWIDQRAA